MNKKTKLPLLDMELILGYVLKKSREYILAHPEYKLNKLQIINFELQIKKRIKGWSVAAITGEKEFFGLKFSVDKHVLIPRPETELMVEEALKLATHNTQHITIIDVGTGSGCIIITLARLIKNYKLKIKNYKFVGIDISKSAINTAKKNAKLNGIEKNIIFLHGNLLKPILKNIKLLILNSKFLILANLPYLTPAQIKNSPTIQREPKLALMAGPDGLKYYRQLFKQIINMQKAMRDTRCSIRDQNPLNSSLTKGRNITVLCEIDPSLKNNFIRLAKKELPDMNLEIKKDLKGHNRLVILYNN